MNRTILFLSLFPCLLMSCSMKEGLSLVEPVSARIVQSDFTVENNQIVLTTSREDALLRGISDTRYEQVSDMVSRLNERITAFLEEYERAHESRSLPVYMAHGYLYSTTYGGSDHAGPVQVGYGDSFTVFADYSGSNYLFGGQHTLKIEWLYGNREFDQEGDGATQYYFNNEQGPVDLYYSYRCDIYTNSQCFWIIFGYFAE